MNDPPPTDPLASLSRYLNALKSDPAKRREVLSVAFGSFVALMGFGVIFLIWKRSGSGSHIEGLFAGFAFWGLMLTIWIQMRQIREGREDLLSTLKAHRLAAMIQAHTSCQESILRRIAIREGRRMELGLKGEATSLEAAILADKNGIDDVRAQAHAARLQAILAEIDPQWAKETPVLNKALRTMPIESTVKDDRDS